MDLDQLDDDVEYYGLTYAEAADYYGRLAVYFERRSRWHHRRSMWHGARAARAANRARRAFLFAFWWTAGNDVAHLVAAAAGGR